MSRQRAPRGSPSVSVHHCAWGHTLRSRPSVAAESGPSPLLHLRARCRHFAVFIVFMYCCPSLLPDRTANGAVASIGIRSEDS